MDFVTRCDACDNLRFLGGAFGELPEDQGDSEDKTVSRAKGIVPGYLRDSLESVPHRIGMAVQLAGARLDVPPGVQIGPQGLLQGRVRAPERGDDPLDQQAGRTPVAAERSEERRVGKGGRYRGWAEEARAE